MTICLKANTLARHMYIVGFTQWNWKKSTLKEIKYPVVERLYDFYSKAARHRCVQIVTGTKGWKSSGNFEFSENLAELNLHWVKGK